MAGILSDTGVVPRPSSQIPTQVLRDLSRPSALRWGRRALTTWAEIVGLIWLAGWVDRLEVYLLIGVLVGARQHALSLLAHDIVHYAAGPHRAVNDWLGQLLAFWPLYGPLDGYRAFHMKHHRTTGTAADPEHGFKRRTPDEWQTPLTWRRALAMTAGDLSGWNAGQLLELGRLSPPRSTRDRLGPLVFWTVATAALIRAGCWWAGWYYWACYFTSYWAAFRWRAWFEHQGTDGTHRLEASPLLRWLILPHNTWLHYEHHAAPSVPCWNLPALREHVPGPAPRPAWRVLADLTGGPRATYGVVLASSAQGAPDGEAAS